jgi:hypothetical protein
VGYAVLLMVLTDSLGSNFNSWHVRDGPGGCWVSAPRAGDCWVVVALWVGWLHCLLAIDGHALLVNVGKLQHSIDDGVVC